MIDERCFPDTETLVDALGATIAEVVRASVRARGRASMVVPGGTTPAPLFAHLAARSLPWHQVEVTLSDERWVPSDHADSNERLVRSTLVQHQAATLRFHGLWCDTTGPEDACRLIGAALAPLRPFDLVLLGMGTDGHFASLFPDLPNLDAALAPSATDTCVAVPAAGGRQARLSLTLGALLDSHRIVLLITGEAKREVYQRARAGDRTLPVAALLASEHPHIDAYWAPGATT